MYQIILKNNDFTFYIPSKKRIQEIINIVDQGQEICSPKKKHHISTNPQLIKRLLIKTDLFTTNQIDDYMLYLYENNIFPELLPSENQLTVALAIDDSEGNFIGRIHLDFIAKPDLSNWKLTPLADGSSVAEPIIEDYDKLGIGQPQYNICEIGVWVQPNSKSLKRPKDIASVSYYTMLCAAFSISETIVSAAYSSSPAIRTIEKFDFTKGIIRDKYTRDILQKLPEEAQSKLNNSPEFKKWFYLQGNEFTQFEKLIKQSEVDRNKDHWAKLMTNQGLETKVEGIEDFKKTVVELLPEITHRPAQPIVSCFSEQ